MPEKTASMSENSQNPMFELRRAGILLHPTSLPGPGNSGNIGSEARHFVDFLAAAGCSVWQTLPLGPTHPDGSPYQSLSAHAIDPALCSADWLRGHGLLPDSLHVTDNMNISVLLEESYRLFRQQHDTGLHQQYQAFQQQHQTWLTDFSLFLTIREQHGNRPWMAWDAPLRDRHPNELKKIKIQYSERIDYHSFCQFVMFQQWLELKQYCHEQGVFLFGDLPIYVAHDSAEVWAHRKLFSLDNQGHAEFVAGVPPDYFSATGQRWGNPLYRWDILKQEGYRWWIERIRTQLELYDLMRIDHFRGLQAYWEIPAAEDTALNGRWVTAPGHELLAALEKTFGKLPIVAEDLGTITEEVHRLRQDFAIPGMSILQFAFDGDPDNLYLPHNHSQDTVVYTGTHDNDTTLSWFESLEPATREYVCHYYGQGHCDMPWTLIRSALASVARLSILPMQDILSLGVGHRMNTPGTLEGNWDWRFDWHQVYASLAGDLRNLVQLYGRLR
jgi:4-alpha-glucanotransferase